ncbi:MAG: primosomal protein N' [Bacteroidetes bacterium]|nr:primosomal protein N' [Bacteroidota bacterium]
MDKKSRFADVLLPLPVSTYTYAIPDGLAGKAVEGGRVVVQFGKRKIYTALVVEIHDRKPESHEAKEILAVLDESPIIFSWQLKFWNWIAAYYLCHAGEVMNAALPSAFKLASESKVALNPEFDPAREELNEKESLLLEALHNRPAIEISEVSKIIGQMKVIPVIKTMLEKGMILMEEELPERYRPRKETFVRLTEEYSGEEKFKELFELLERKARKQMELLMSFLVLSKYGTDEPCEVTRTGLLKSVRATPSALDGLVAKGVMELYEKVVSRVKTGSAVSDTGSIELMDFQQNASDAIRKAFGEKEVVLLHGVTSSGKTELYIKYIREAIDKGQQVLYLLPEIALTTQTISRLTRYFGERVGVYHSRFNENERVEIWNKVLSHGKSEIAGTRPYDIILGARSAVFLPFSNLGLVIVDEEHDSSFKQYDPSPRYNGRDAALYLAHLHAAKTILGSATPSIESYYNCQEGKYALVEMTERYRSMEMPEIHVVNLREEIRWKKMKSHFSSVLVNQLEDALGKGEQSIIFQNRRGFSLRLECESCGWMPTCKNCDVTLVYHKQNNQLRCHYCGYTTYIPEKCPECKGISLKMKGFGTEKVEEELGLLFPKARITRMDLDTTRTRLSHQKIINDLEERKIDILVGTQMVTKGLDFENVSTVSILNADNMLGFPDFRSAERSFQLMAQVSGRSGRKNKRGQVIIQTYNPKHPVILDVVNHDYKAMYEQQLVDRRKFKYPPFYRLVLVKVKHKDPAILNRAADELARRLRKLFGNRVLGPEYPLVSRIMNYYLKQILVKIERQASQTEMKKQLMLEIEEFSKIKEFSPLRLVIDVDPQ